MKRLSSGVALAASLLLAMPALAQDPRVPLRTNVPVDLTITMVGGAAWLGSELLLKSTLAPKTCKWCDRNVDGSDSLNGLDASVRNALLWHNPNTANVLSNVAEFALVPLVTLGGSAWAAQREGASSNIPTDLLVIGEAAMLAQDLNQVVKLTAGRERPFVHALPESEKALTSSPLDNNVSFFSGHTTFAFSMAVASGTVASMHGYKLAPWIWASGLTLATTTAVLRIGADKHYFTDVMTGALVGSAIGFGVPYLLHQPQAKSLGAAQNLALTAAPLPGGATASLGFTW